MKKTIIRCGIIKWSIISFVFIAYTLGVGSIANKWGINEGNFTLKVYKEIISNDSIEIISLKEIIKAQDQTLKNQDKSIKQLRHIDLSIDTLIDNTKKKKK